MTAIAMPNTSLFDVANGQSSPASNLSSIDIFNQIFVETLEKINTSEVLGNDVGASIQADDSIVNSPSLNLDPSALTDTNYATDEENRILQEVELATLYQNFALFPSIAQVPATATEPALAPATATASPEAIAKKIADGIENSFVPMFESPNESQILPTFKPLTSTGSGSVGLDEVQTLNSPEFMNPRLISDVNKPVVEMTKQGSLDSFHKFMNARSISYSGKPLDIPTDTSFNFSKTPESATQAVTQSTPVGSIILDKKSQINMSVDRNTFSSTEVFLKNANDSNGSIKSGNLLDLNESKKSVSEVLVQATPSSGQVSLVPVQSPDYSQQVHNIESTTQTQSPEDKWTNNLADTVNRWVERSLQLAELTVPAAGQDMLQVRIELNGQEATVQFLTDHVQYREALNSQIDHLSDRLADQGLKLTGSSVGHGGAQNSPHSQTTQTVLSQRFENNPAQAKALPIDQEQRPSKSIHLGRYLDVFA